MRPDAGARAVDLLNELVAIPSVTGSEGPLLDFFEERYRTQGWIVEPIEVSPGRRNLFLRRRRARVVLTTHADTVPPFFPPRREGGYLVARGACDAKGALAAQAVALEELALELADVGLLLLVGEERGSDGALAANHRPYPAEYLVGGEPTGNRFVAGSKGCLRVEITSRGIAGHSSVPESGRSAVEPLLDVLGELRLESFGEHPIFGVTTRNIGVIQAGTAPNVLAESARAEILFRTGTVAEVLSRVETLADGRAEVAVRYRSDPILFRVPRGKSGDIVSFACDLPLLRAWGEPILVGPGSILDAHTAEEKVELSQIEEAVAIYCNLARDLLERPATSLEPRRE